MTKKKQRYLEIGFLLLIFAFYTIWALVQPFNSAPDELMRYNIPEFIFKHGALPHGGDPEIRNEIWGISYGFTPILSYILSAGLMKVVSFFTANAFALLMAARMVSVICATGTVFFCIRIAKKLFNGMYQWVFVLLVALLPQFVFISSYVNTDSMAIFGTAMIVYAWIIGLENRWRIKDCILLAIGISVTALSYYNAYGFILCSIVLFAISALCMSERKWDWRKLLSKGGIITGIVLVLIAWWFIRSYIIYNGDFIGMATSEQFGNLYAIDSHKPMNIITPQSQGVSLWGMLVENSWLGVTFKSFIGYFGYMDIPLQPWMYQIYYLLFTGGALGIVAKLINTFTHKNKNAIKVLFTSSMVVSLIIPTLISVYYSYTSDFQPQGRYIMPMIIPLMFFVTLGVQAVIERLFDHKIVRLVLQILICLAIIVVAILCYTNILFPYYIK